MFKETPETKIKDYAKDLPPEEGKKILDGLKELKKVRRNAKLFSVLADWGMLDPLVGLIPELGDGGTALAGLYIVYKAKEMGMPTKDLMKMMGNQITDIAVGAIPVIGDALDVFYMSNRKNFKMLDAYFKDPKNTDQILATIEGNMQKKKAETGHGAKTNLVELSSAAKRAQFKAQEGIDKKAA